VDNVLMEFAECEESRRDRERERERERKRGILGQG